MDEAVRALKTWLLIDPSVRHQVKNMVPGDVYKFRYTTTDARIAEATFTYEETRTIMAKLVLLGAIK